jgi:hypothetical protein
MSLNDEELVGTVELLSDGTDTIFSGATVVSTTTGTKVIVLSGVDLFREPEQLEEFDTVTLAGTSPDVDGDYTVQDVLTLASFSVKESIGNSTGGTCTATYPSGARKVGFDPDGLTYVTATNVQEAIEELDASVGGGGDDDDQVKDNVPTGETFTVKDEHQHIIFDELVIDGEYQVIGESVIFGGEQAVDLSSDANVRRLILFIDNGPAEGFASGAYRETTGTVFVTAVIWYVNSTKAEKIVEKNITWEGVKEIEHEWILYDSDGSTVLVTVTDTMEHTGIFETSRTREITVA